MLKGVRVCVVAVAMLGSLGNALGRITPATGRP